MIDLPPFQSKLVEEFAPALSQIGFNVEPFGPASVSLRGIPATLEVDRAQEIFVNIASDIERIGKRIDPEKLIKELVLSASCHGAIKVNTSLNRQKMNWLIDSLFNCEMPMRCPHGRPVVLTIAESELRHRFGRS
jgi:DNA mismatch repair protein MutL